MSELRSASMFGSRGPSNGCVLVVVDDPMVRSAICQTLEQAGYDVLEAKGADHGIETIKTGENPLVVDAVLTDIDMDGGMEAATYFRSQYRHVPLVVMTGLPDASADGAGRTRVAILGAGRGGSALLDMFSHLPDVEVVGIADLNPSAPGLTRAHELKIPVVDDALQLIVREDIQLLVDVTGDARMERLMEQYKPARTEVLGGAAAKLLWTLVQHETRMQRQLLQSEKVTGMIKEGVADYLLKPIRREKLLTAIGQAMERREISRL